jgi:hypothetical protein
VKPGSIHARTVGRIVPAVLAVALALPVAAEEFLPDPTRPMILSGGGDGAVRYVETGPMLQATRISAMQKSATIDGKTYRVGEQYAGSEITDIQPYEVVLRAPERRGAVRIWRLRMVPKLTGAAAATADELKIKRAAPQAQEESR